MAPSQSQAFLHPSQARSMQGAAAKPSPSMFSHLPAASSGSLYGRLSPLWRGVGEALPPSRACRLLGVIKVPQHLPVTALDNCVSTGPMLCLCLTVPICTSRYLPLLWTLKDGLAMAWIPTPSACVFARQVRVGQRDGYDAGATLARDVPFSALYWSSLEPIRRAMLPSNARASQAQIMTANFVAGTVGGGLAAAVTTPLDVVKTRLQVKLAAPVADLLQHAFPKRSSCSTALTTWPGRPSNWQSIGTHTCHPRFFKINTFTCRKMKFNQPAELAARVEAQLLYLCRWRRENPRLSCRP